MSHTGAKVPPTVVGTRGSNSEERFGGGPYHATVGEQRILLSSPPTPTRSTIPISTPRRGILARCRYDFAGHSFARTFVEKMRCPAMLLILEPNRRLFPASFLLFFLSRPFSAVPLVAASCVHLLFPFFSPAPSFPSASLHFLHPLRSSPAKCQFPLCHPGSPERSPPPSRSYVRMLQLGEVCGRRFAESGPTSCAEFLAAAAAAAEAVEGKTCGSGRSGGKRSGRGEGSQGRRRPKLPAERSRRRAFPQPLETPRQPGFAGARTVRSPRVARRALLGSLRFFFLDSQQR